MKNKLDISGLYSEFSGLIEQIDHSIDRIKNEKDWEYSDSTEEDYTIKSNFRKGDFISYYHIYNSAKKEFNYLKKKINTNINLKELPKIDKNIDIGLTDFIVFLNIIKIQSIKAMGVLEEALTPITDNARNRLKDLEEDFSKFYPKIPQDYKKNIKKAINAYRLGLKLASSLISSRVIIFALDEILNHIKEVKKEVKNGDKIGQIIDFILEKKLIDKHDETRTYLIRISRLARNRFSHNIKSYPDSGDPLSLLDGCLKFVEILSKI